MCRFLLSLSFVMLFVLTGAAVLQAAPAGVRFVQPSQCPDRYDFVEVAIEVDRPDAANPFTDVTVEGQITRRGTEPVRVDGFCDGADGSLFRLRFMPTQPGNYRYSMTYRQGAYQVSRAGEFKARDVAFP